ncbi:MAG TPA: M23 family metallopeptidase [Candidatus Limnocylindria bacterium]
MRSCNARKRALLTLCLALSALLPLGRQAAADGPTRALPTARGYQRAFSSYDSLTAYAQSIASDQTQLDAQLADVIAAHRAAEAQIAQLLPSSRGGALFVADEFTGASERAREIDALEAQVAGLDVAYAKVIAAGALTVPTAPWQMPTDGEITQPFGPTAVWVEPSETYQGVTYAHFHEGVDIAGAWAAPVYAPKRGRVVFVGRMPDGAEVVVLAHDDGYVSMYAHLDDHASPPTVAAGDEVAAGQQIGTVGLTGMTTGEHLHWAVWHEGTLVDPLSLMGQ